MRQELRPLFEKRRAFWQVAQQIRRRLELLASLPFEKLDALRLQAATAQPRKETGLLNGNPNGNPDGKKWGGIWRHLSEQWRCFTI